MRLAALSMTILACFFSSSPALTAGECEHAGAYMLTPPPPAANCDKGSPEEQVRCLNKELRNLRLAVRAMQCLMKPQLQKVQEGVEPAQD